MIKNLKKFISDVEDNKNMMLNYDIAIQIHNYLNNI